MEVGFIAALHHIPEAFLLKLTDEFMSCRNKYLTLQVNLPAGVTYQISLWLWSR